MTTVANATVISKNNAKTHAIIVYALIGLGLFTAIPILIGAVWAMIKRREALGTIYHSHLTNAVRVFWWGIFWTIIAGILLFAVIGVPILMAAWLWSLYRVVNGVSKVLSGVPYPLF